MTLAMTFVDQSQITGLAAIAAVALLGALVLMLRGRLRRR